MLTQAQVHELFDYDPETGIFIWRVSVGAARVGHEAGRLNKHRGYRYIGFQNRAYMAHRLAWLYVHGCWPAADIDHINRNRQDNRICNLREASRAQNLHNSVGHRDSICGLKGVSFDRARGTYQTRIYVGGRTRHLGRYSTPEAAHAVYKEAAIKLRGEFARF